MKHLFIVNPIAGSRDASEDLRGRIQRAFHHRADSWELYVTKAPRDATEKIRQEAASGEALRVYACGGDGTFNECVCGAALLPNVAVCPVPTGTGNDFCRMFGADAALFRDLDALLDGEVREIDLISCNGSYSANICSVGIDARIGTEVHRYSSLPLVGGAGAYVISAVVNAVRGIATGMRVRCGSYDSHEKYSLVCACNGRFYGGGFNPSPTAMLDDGLLDIFIVKKVSLFTFARCIGKYASGHADDFPQFITHLRDTELSIEFDREDVINLDGEGLRAKSVNMKLIPKALKLIIPKGLGRGTEVPPLKL